ARFLQPPSSIGGVVVHTRCSALRHAALRGQGSVYGAVSSTREFASHNHNAVHYAFGQWISGVTKWISVVLCRIFSKHCCGSTGSFPVHITAYVEDALPEEVGRQIN